MGMEKPLKFTRGSRKHRIGRAHAKHVMATVAPIVIPADEDTDERFVWIGDDDRGLELEIVAINLPTMVLVIHVMPTALRKKATP
jgi:hypothetical protein